MMVMEARNIKAKRTRVVIYHVKIDMYAFL